MEGCSSLVIDRETLEERVARSSPEFPYVANLCSMEALMDRTCPWHWHEEVELFYIRAGVLEYHLPSGCHVFQAGEGGFLNAGVLHMTRQRGEVPCLQEEVLFHPRFVGGEEDSLINRKYIRPLVEDPGLALLRLGQDRPEERELLELVRQALAVYQGAEPGWELESKAQAARMLRYALELSQGREWVARPGRRANSLRVKTMMEFMDAHYREKLTLDQIAQAGCVSPRECSRCFQETLGLSPFQYLTDLRLRQSCRLLAHTGLSVTEIAVSCGFGTSSYFSRTFRCRFGCAPREYRKDGQRERGGGD
ncbi:AraC family transcriptional regulator [Pseudoflavonifractor sp. 60]|uniref:helix-turn-helix transcriptional regulator n=1 Tax=Pseudoflavonifractor sp. 60 TaxID=2304576 RepID=UPI00136C06A3|nr:AraC family transcriptional regulator [Pseudoflavonifractor sp. 60]NBI67733.1 AraC family transcriptional regulator [Pseudoflavonifractor sp. 60]